VADNSTQGGTDTIRDKDRTGVKTQIFGLDQNIGGGSESLMTSAALGDATANPTVPTWAMCGMVFNGTTWDRVRGDTTNGLDVDVTRLPALPAGTNNIGDVDVLTLPSLPAGAAVIGKVDINSAPQVAVNNVETLTDNAGFTDGTSKVFPSGYIFDESAGTALTENDVGAARIQANRAVVTVTEDGVTRGRYATVKAASTAAAATDPAQVVSLSPNSPATAPTLTKGTQGSAGWSVQNLKDSGRVNIMWTVDQFITAGATEAMLTFTESRDGAATSTTASKTITSGKRLRITSIMASAYAGGTTPAISRLIVKMRVNTAGAVATTSPLQFTLPLGVAAAAKSLTTVTHQFPDGVEFLGNGTVTIGFSCTSIDFVTTTNTPILSLSVTAFEY